MVSLRTIVFFQFDKEGLMQLLGKKVKVLNSAFCRNLATTIVLVYFVSLSAQRTVAARVPELLQSNLWLRACKWCSTTWYVGLIVGIAFLFDVIAFTKAYQDCFLVSSIFVSFGEMVIAIIVAYVLVGAIVASVLKEQGIGTIQAGLDKTFQQEDLALVGELGTYGGLLEDTETGAKDYYICRSVDNYGPFSFPALVSSDAQPFIDESFELFIYEAEEDSAYSLTMRHYDDGYWISVKRFASAEKLGVEIESVADMEKYILQLEYANHYPTNGSESSLLRDLRQELDAFGVVN